MNDLLLDIAFAWRNALRKPATALLIVATLALGIGANSAMFSVAWHVLVAPLPYADGERLVKLEQSEPRLEKLNFNWSGPTLGDIREQSTRVQGTVFSDLLEYTQLPFTIVGRGEPHQGLAGITNWPFFAALGARPVLGRLFASGDDQMGAPPVLLLSHEFWVNKFAADPAVVGTTLEIKDIVYTVIGVLPRLPPYPHGNDVWIPAASDPYRLFSRIDVDTNRESTWITYVLAKLNENVSFSEASRELDTIAQRLVENYPDVYAEDYSLTLTPLKDELVGDSSTTFLLLLGLAFLIVLIAIANVANLNLASAIRRNQELAIREAVGANPARIARQLLTEAMLYALAGGLLGLIVAYACLGLLKSFAAGYTPLASEIALDGSIFLFSFMLALLTGILSGAAAAFGARDINKALKEGGDKITTTSKGKRRRELFLVVQFTLSFVILTTSALIMLSLYRLNNQNTGYDTSQVLAVNVPLNLSFSGSFAERRQHMLGFAQNLLEKTQAIPGVAFSGLLSGGPLLQDVSFLVPATFEIDGQTFADAEAGPRTPIQLISENYFRAMDIPLLAGRMFAQTDDENALPVAIINKNFADRYFPAGNAVGQQIKMFGHPSWRVVVGVVDNIRSKDLNQVEDLAVYYHFFQFPGEGVNLYVKSTGDLKQLAGVVTGIIHELDPRQGVEGIRPLIDVKAAWLAPSKLRGILISLFGILAMFITLTGVVGVISYNISQRVREIGVHMALGANPSVIVRLFLTQSLLTYLCGLLLGFVLMSFVAPLLEPLLYQTTALDPAVYLASALVLTAGALIAMYLPARKAGAMSPTMALHSE